MSRVRDMTSRNCGRAVADVVKDLRSFLLGWGNYFEVAATYAFERLDRWIRHRLRCLICKQRNPHGHGGWWRVSKTATSIPNAYFDQLGLPRLSMRDLNNTNRRMRTRTSGGVGGDRR